MNISFWTCQPDIRLQDKCSQIERAFEQFTPLKFSEGWVTCSGRTRFPLNKQGNDKSLTSPFPRFKCWLGLKKLPGRW